MNTRCLFTKHLQLDIQSKEKRKEKEINNRIDHFLTD